MLSVRMQLEIKAPPSEVWEVIGGFNNLPDWLPLVEKSSLENKGKVRRLKLAGGGESLEQLEEHQEKERFYRFSMIRTTLPISNYVSTLRVNAQGGGRHSIVDWSSHFNALGVSPEEAVRIIESSYQAGFDQLQKIFKQRVASASGKIPEQEE